MKILFHRANDVNPRYEVSEPLREILPGLRVDPSIEDVTLAVWQYAQVNGLIDKKFIKCNEAFRSIFSSEYFPVSNLRNNLMHSHLFPAKPIQVEYQLTLQGTCPPDEAVKNLLGWEKRYSVASINRSGGRAFDLEVDVFDEFAFDTLDLLNSSTKLQEDIDSRLAIKYSQACFIAKSIMEKQNELMQLKQIVRNALSDSQTSVDCASSNAPEAQPAPLESTSSSFLGTGMLYKKSADVKLADNIHRNRSEVMHGIADTHVLIACRKVLQIDR